jgi:hypothetical protein
LAGHPDRAWTARDGAVNVNHAGLQVTQSGKGSVVVHNKARVVVVGAESDRPHQRACLIASARAFHAGMAQRGMNGEVVLATVSGSETHEAYEASPQPVRGFTWEAMDAEAAARAMYYAGLQPMRAGDSAWGRMPLGAYVVADDGIRHLCDCDVWIFMSPAAPAAFLPLRPFLVFADDDVHHASGALSPDGLRVVAENLTAAAGVLVWSDDMLQEVVHFYGVERDRVRLLPRLTGCQRLVSTGLGITSQHHQLEVPVEQGQVWFVAEASSVAFASSEGSSSVMDRSGTSATAWSDDDEQMSMAYGEALAELL